MDSHYEEKEIDLRRLLYYVCKHWRGIMVTVFLAVLVVGGTKCAVEFVSVSDPEHVEERQLQYSGELAAYRQEGAAIRHTIEELQVDIRHQKDYNEASELMKINPYEDWHGTMGFYVETDYRIMPELSYQNENIAKQIIQVYDTYLAGGELHRQVNEALGLSMEQRYLREILTGTVDMDTYLLHVSVRGVSEEECRKLLAAAEQGIREKQKEILESVGEFELKMTANTTYSQVSYELEAYQEENRRRITEMENEHAVQKLAYLEWQHREEEIIPPVLSRADALVVGAKWAVIGAVVAMVLVAGVLAVRYATTGTVQDKEGLPGGLTLLAELPGTEVKRKGSGIDRRLAKSFGILLRKNEAEASMAALAELLARSGTVTDKKEKRVSYVLVGDGKPEAIRALAEKLQVYGGSAISVLAGGNPVNDASAVEKLANAEEVVLIAEKGVSKRETLLQIEERVRFCGKTCLGVVLTNCDAI